MLTTPGIRPADHRPPMPSARAQGPARRALQAVRGQERAALLALVALLVISAFRGSHLFTGQGLASASVELGPLVLAVLALVPLALGTAGGLDLSIGPLVVLVNVVITSWLAPHGVSNPVVIVGAAVLIGVAYEVLVGALILVLRVEPIIVTLSGYLVLGGVDVVILSHPGGSSPRWLSHWGSAQSIWAPPLLIIVGCAVAWFLASKTTFYRNLRLTGANERTAFVSGVAIARVRLGWQVVAGVLAGLAGLLQTGLLGSGDPTQGATITLTAVTALLFGGVALSGGRGSPLGALCGAVDIFLIGYVLNTFQFGSEESFVVQLVYGLILIVVLLSAAVRTRSRRGRPVPAVPAPAGKEPQ